MSEPPKKRRKTSGPKAGIKEMTQPEVDMISGMVATVEAGRLLDRRAYPKPTSHYLRLWSKRGRDTCLAIMNGTYKCPAAKQKLAPSARGTQKLEAQHPDIIDKSRAIIRTINRADPVEQCYAEKVLTQLRTKHPDYMQQVRTATSATAPHCSPLLTAGGCARLTPVRRMARSTSSACGGRCTAPASSSGLAATGSRSRARLQCRRRTAGSTCAAR
jgi:hypothetical protein